MHSQQTQEGWFDLIKQFPGDFLKYKTYLFLWPYLIVTMCYYCYLCGTIIENYSLATDSEKQLPGGVLLWDEDEMDR